ncbi:GNAT family N-acetyltransferase [Alicyclobacillus curvatus]|nr:GNAT family N-acetyltransferase [Alicyclobacillus curvatus]
MFTYIVDEEVSLRLVERRHVEELFQVIVTNADHVGRWLPFARATTQVTDTLAFVDSALIDFAAGKGLVAGIWYCSQLVGTIGLRIDKGHQSASVGYWIDSSHEGRGIVTRACRALINFAFDELKLHRIEIRANPGNVKSRAIPERLDFVEEGIVRGAFKLYDKFEDSIIYGLLCDEWHHKR